MTAPRLLPLIVLLLFPSVIGAGGKNGLSAEDIAKIKQAHTRYEEAWLKGDADGVRALFTEDCVLLPPHADKPRIGQKGLNEFWFPPHAPATQITKLVVTPHNNRRRRRNRNRVGHRRSRVDHAARRQNY
jgi:hypothetical protein